MKSKVLGVEFQFFEKNVLGRDGFGQNWIQGMNSMTIPDIKMRFLPMLEILRVIFFPSTLWGVNQPIDGNRRKLAYLSTSLVRDNCNHCLENGRLQTGRFKTGHFEMPLSYVQNFRG